LHLPDHIPLEEGALAEPLAVAAHAVRISRVCLGTSVLIQGCGPIGISLLAMCRRAGAGKIIMTDVTQFNMDAARQMGADVLINAKDQNVVQEVLSKTGGEGVEVVFMAIGKDSIMGEAIQCTKRYGQIMEVAHFGSEPPFDARNYRWKELAMQGSYMFVRKDFEIVISAIAGGQIKAGPMISKIVPVEDCAAVMKMAHDRTEDFVKILFKF
jgi:L-iditol 2-dehydrogenase